jgi:hypothetical protein
MQDNERESEEPEARAKASAHRLRLAEGASGIGSFEVDLASGNWNWSQQAAVVLGIDPLEPDRSFATLQQAIFIDDVPKILSALENAPQTGSYSVEFRVRHANGSLHWIAAKGRIDHSPALLRGAIFDITERKALEARLLAVNETLEARVGQVREEARTLEVLNRTGVAVAAEHDLERLVQLVTDAGVELSHAAFGAFFYNVIKQGGEAYTLYTLSGAPRSAFEISDAPQHRHL